MADPDPQPDPNTSRILDRSVGDYQKLAKFMGRWPEMCIYRRFGDLNAQNILFLQAEISHLEWELKIIRERDNAQNSNSEKQCSQSWWIVSRQTNGTHTEQYQKILQIREKLQQYNDALLQYNNLCGLHRPTKHNLQVLRYYLTDTEGGDCFLGTHQSENPWHEKHKSLQADLITLSDEHHQRDIFSAWIGDNVLTWYQTKFGHLGKRQIRDVEGSMTYYGDSKIAAICRFFGALVASLLPPVSIFILFFVEDLFARLGAILALSALFSFSLAIFTKATKREIFAATAAFASVQVVFVGQAGSHHHQFRYHLCKLHPSFC